MFVLNVDWPRYCYPFFDIALIDSGAINRWLGRPNFPGIFADGKLAADRVNCRLAAHLRIPFGRCGILLM